MNTDSVLSTTILRISVLLVFLLTRYYASYTQFQPEPKFGVVVAHTHYALSYVEEYEQPEWVYYYLSREDLDGTSPRSNKFKSDSLVISKSAQLADYSGSGYDRGHLSPAADNKISSVIMNESFLMSNMSPQVPAFNRGIWKSLEELFRVWAELYDGLYIVTSGILSGDLERIGENEVAVPRYYYKIGFSEKEQKGIGFILPNEKVENTLSDYVVTIDSIESLTNLDFFAQLPDSVEAIIESKINLETWAWIK